MGSSPRVWGQVYNTKILLIIPRIIPTRVGTSLYNIALCINAEDHPHACGDKWHSNFCLRLESGSSPRVWGQEGGTVVAAVDGRIIPTRVGTSIAGMPKKTINEDHPHACGDKHDKNVICDIPSGSSPRVWGQGLQCT